MRILDVTRLGSCLAFAIAVYGTRSAYAQTKIACLGESVTHSAHRIHDPEYPEFLGRFLDSDFKLEAQMNPLDGGMLYGSGTNYRIGNFGLPTGSALDVDNADVTSTFASPQLVTAEKFGPDVVVLGPYGPHEPYANVSLPDRFVPDLTKLAQKIMGFASKPTVFLALPIARYGEDTDTVRHDIHDYTVQVSKDLNLPTIDLWTEFMGKRAEFYDQNHLAEAGNQHLGNFVGAVIQKWKAGGAVGSGGMSGSAGGAATSAGTSGVAAGGALGTVGSDTGGVPAVSGSSGGSGAAPSAGASSTAQSAGGAPAPTGTVGTGGASSTPVGSAGGSNSAPLPTGNELAHPNADTASGCSLSTAPGSQQGSLAALVALSLLALTGGRRSGVRQRPATAGGR
jgi:hypothetical protein